MTTLGVSITAVLLGLFIGGTTASATLAYADASRLTGRRGVLVLGAVCIFLGAAAAGQPVAVTIGERLAPDVIGIPEAGSILIASLTCMVLSYTVALPVSTSQATMGAVIGVGMVRRTVVWGTVAQIIGFGLGLMLLAFVISYALHLLWLRLQVNRREATRWGHIPAIAMCCYLSFAAGANNAANAVAPLMAAGVLARDTATTVGGVILGLGVILIGARLVPTMSRGISRLSPPQSVISSFSTATSLLTGSILGIPISLVQMTAGSITASGCSHAGLGNIWRHSRIRHLLIAWFCSPAIAIVISYISTVILDHLSGR